MFYKTIHGVEFQVDDADYERFVKGYRFYLNRSGYVIFSSSKDGYNGKYLHRVIMGNPQGEIDHINRDKLDNRRQNLRTATCSENRCNRGLQSNNTSGFKGVCWDERNQKWLSYVMINGKQIHVGRYKHKIKAAMVAAIVRIVAHGKFAAH
jgi:hypothetical protein